MAGAGSAGRGFLRELLPFARQIGEALGRGGKGVSTNASRLPKIRGAAAAATAATKATKPVVKKAVPASGRGVRTAKTAAAARTTAKKSVATAGKRADAGARTAARKSATAGAAAKKSVAASGKRADAAGRAAGQAAREAAAKAVAQKRVIARGLYDSSTQLKWAKRSVGAGLVGGTATAFGMGANSPRKNMPPRPSSLMGSSAIMGGSAGLLPRRPASSMGATSIMGGLGRPSKPTGLVGSSSIMGGRPRISPKLSSPTQETNLSRPSQGTSSRGSRPSKPSMPKMVKGRTVSQSNTEWVAKGTMVNGKAVPKGYLAQKGKPGRRVTANVRIATPSQGEWTPAGGGQMVGGTKKGEVYAYKGGRRTGAMKKK